MSELKTSWKLGLGLAIIIGLLAVMLWYTDRNISVLKNELGNRKTYDNEVALINSLVIRIEDFYSNSNNIGSGFTESDSRTLRLKNDSIYNAIAILDSVSNNKPYAGLVDTVSSLYSRLVTNTNQLIMLQGMNNQSFDAPLLEMISQATDSLKKDSSSFQRTKLQSTTIVVEKPVVVKNTNVKKRKKKNEQTEPPVDSLTPAITGWQQTDTVLTDSTFFNKVDGAFGKLSNEIVKLKKTAEKKEEFFNRKFRQAEKGKQELYQRINRLLQEIREEEQRQLAAKIDIAATQANNSLSVLTVIFFAAGVLSVLFFLLIAYDISRSNYFRKKLEIAKEQAEKMARDKEDFLAKMSHELRTPLNAITGFTHLLHNHPSREDKYEYIRQIEHSADHLLSLINNTLDFTKLENGEAKPNPVDFDAAQCIRDVAGSLTVLANEKKLELYKKIRPLPFLLFGDELWLKQILFNLIGNAIKYTSEGSVTVDMDWIEEGKNVQLKVRVSDTGPGIPKDQIPMLFDAYKMVTQKSTRGIKGTGLGLAITKKLALYQNGDILVESTPGKGSTFTLVIPYIRGTKAAVASPAQMETPDLKGKSVLLVDDDGPSLMLLQILLKRWGADVKTAVNVPLAIEKIRAEPYAWIIMDWNLENLSGEEILKFMSTSGMDTPVIVCSADQKILPVLQSYQSLDIQVVPKPVDPAQLALSLQGINVK